ncbi:MAG: universal stress protein [Pseudomonadales bacterium]|jgi:universal stress protein E|nr:universal stress protein [Pseudomonadales bacterium]
MQKSATAIRTLRHALVVLEGLEAPHPALERALALARQAELRLTLVLWDYVAQLDHGYLFERVQRERLREERRKEKESALDAMTAPMREDGLEVDAVYAWGSSATEAILQVADSLQPDLLIAPIHVHPRLSLRHQDWGLIQHASAPVLLTRGKPWGQPVQLLAAVDPTHDHDKPAVLDHGLLALGRQLEARLSGELHVAHLFDVDAVPARWRESIRTVHADAFEAFRAVADVPDERLHYRELPAETGLLRLTEELKTDLLIMGAVKRGRLDQALIGHTAERVIDLVQCDLLVLKPGQLST